MFFCCAASSEPKAEVVDVVGTSETPAEPLPVESPGVDAPLEEAPTVEKKVEEPAAAEEPTAEFVQFDVRLAKPAGMKLDFWKEAIQIADIKEGADHSVIKYNLGLGDDDIKKIRSNDFIIAVNQVSGSVSEMAAVIDKELEFTLTILRPRVFVAEVSKGDARLGMKMVYQSMSSSCLHINEVYAGQVEEYNKTAPAESQIQARDYIASVNGVEGSGSKIFEKLQQDKDLKFTLLRLPTTPAKDPA